MSLYLLDANVVRELGPEGHRNVRAWLSTVDDANLRLSALTVYEMERGATTLAKREPERAAGIKTRIDQIRRAYRERIVPVDAEIAAEWGRLVGEKDKHRDDMALAATARVRGFILVTRNVGDFAGRGVQVLDPFKSRPEVVVV